MSRITKKSHQAPPRNLYVVEIRMMVETPPEFDLVERDPSTHQTRMDDFINAMCTEMEHLRLNVSYSKPNIIKI